jgi:hypothetical protein|tara:strand:+ start:1548 stop:1757 length:210 start_codon:yes stop_codon:yes gene_type:complete
MQLYDEKSVKKILDDFSKLLMEADNFPREKDPDDYREFWSGLRGEGSSLLGLTRHLLDVLNEKEGKKGE